MDVILHRPHESWLLNDPETWVVVRSYAKRDLAEMLQDFYEERRRSVGWLKGLSSQDWDAVYPAPFGVIKSGDMLAS